MGVVSAGSSQRHQMKVKEIAEACMWLPGFAPYEDPLQVLGTVGSIEASIEHAQASLGLATPESLVVPVKPTWAMLSDSDFTDLSGPVAKFEANIQAITTLRKLEEENRSPSLRERGILNRFTGWGGLPQAFNHAVSDTGWLARVKQLEELLTSAEYQAAHESTTSSHYTPFEVVAAMWRLIARLGFKGGRIIEPSMGVGYFLGAMPQEIAQKSVITGVELDAIPARIAKALYKPYGVMVHHGGFERAHLPKDFYDLAISNVPFGVERVGEVRNVQYADFAVHNYFFAKALEVVRPGGLVAFITSSYTMDGTDSKVREYLASQASLVAAIRLPSKTFKDIAGTEVVTDILILQKHAKAIADAGNSGWRDVIAVPYASPILKKSNYFSSDRQYVNERFVAHPESVIGGLSFRNTGNRKFIECHFEGDLKEALEERLQQAPEGVYLDAAEGGDLAQEERDPDLELATDRRPVLVVIEGKVFEVNGSQAIPCRLTGKSLQRTVGMIGVRDAARKLIAAQITCENDSVLAVYRTALNVTYDTFVADCGYVNEAANRRAFRVDPDLPLLLSLEVWDDDAQMATKAAIFERRTAGMVREVQSCETVEDAMLVCLGEVGRIDPARIAALVRKHVDAVMSELEEGGRVFLDPVTGHWEHADAYLSGRVRDKLLVARSSGDRYARNVLALEGVQPALLGPSDITARVGSTWIPARVYEQFLCELFKRDGFKLSYESLVGAWSLNAPWIHSGDLINSGRYGTDRVCAVDLFELEMNQRKPTVYDTKADGTRVANSKATIEAREKQHDLKTEFVRWLWSDEARAQELAALYNGLFNSTVPRRYNGAHLLLPGLSQVYTPRTHQLDAVWRVVSSSYNTLLAHAVGAGKTLEMVIAGMELKRLGVASKPLYVVPGHMLYQFASDFMAAYPNANILAASKDDLQGDRRRLLLSRIATGNWDAVIMTQGTFESIKISDEYLIHYIQEELQKIEMAIKLHTTSRGNRIVKQLARAKKIWKVKLEKLSKSSRKDELLKFEELGFDWIFVDEAHWAKNLWRFTQMDRVAGLPNSSSERAFDLFVKTRCIMHKRGDMRGLTFSTATPISNSLAEAYTMMRFLQQETLEEHQIESFDSWAANFGESVTALELAPDGSGYRMCARFARFVNLPDLMNIFRLVADIRTPEMLDLPTPKVAMQTVVVKSTPMLRSYVEGLVERASKVRSGAVPSSKDNMLKVTGDGRKAALDLRLVDPMASPQASGKIHQCASNVHRLWREYAHVKGAQLVFCDLSTPRSDGGFNAYDDLRSKLIEMGIPEQEIAFIHDFGTDALKDALFKAVRNGVIRVLIGSTEKMGVGTNVQERLIAVHHLDSPWRPSDLEQRNGRIVRQGNIFSEVFIYTYITENSFDAYMYQILNSKAKFIAQVMTGEGVLRTLEEAELAALSYAEIKALASGNPKVLEKAAVDSELAKMAVVHQGWMTQRRRNTSELNSIPESISFFEAKARTIAADLRQWDMAAGDMKVKVLAKTYSDLKRAQKEMTAALRQVSEWIVEVGEIRGFKITASRASEERWSIRVGDYDLGRVSNGSFIFDLASAHRTEMESCQAAAKKRLVYLHQRVIDLKAELDLPFDKQARLDELLRRQIELDAELDLSTGDMSAVDESEQSDEAMTV